jgi:hypothetical protein
MTRNEANVILAAILETVAEVNDAPSGHMYAALMGKVSLDDYNELLGIARNVGLVTVSPAHLVSITDKGRQMVEKIKAHRAA